MFEKLEIVRSPRNMSFRAKKPHITNVVYDKYVFQF